MMILGFTNTELKAIYTVLAAIIHLSHTKIVKKGKINTFKILINNYVQIWIFF